MKNSSSLFRFRPTSAKACKPLSLPFRRPPKILLLLIVLVVSGPASELCAEETVPAASADQEAGFLPAQGSFSMLLLGGAMREHKDDILLRYGVAAFEYAFSERLAGLAELVRYDVKQEPGGSTDGLGFNLLAALNLYRTHRVVFFGAGGLGLADFQRRMPLPDGTHFNFTIHGRLGLKWLLGDRFWLQAAAQYMHLSNANMEGQERNPSFDGFGGYGGLMVRF